MSLPELEVKCWRCWGEGVLAGEDHGEMIDCPECNGVGWIPTDDGRRLLHFLERHLAVDVEDEQ